MRKSKFNDISAIMDSAAMNDINSSEFSHAKKDEVNTIQQIKIKYIVDNPYQPRLEIKNDSVLELASSIKENGLLQPVTLNKVDDNKYEIIAGHRRIAAHKALKATTVKALIVSELSKEDQKYKLTMAVNALIENLQREDLDILETAISSQNLLNEKIIGSKQDLAKYIGKSNAFVSKVLSVLKLDNDIINDLRINKSIKDLETLYELQKIQNSETQLNFYSELVKGKLSRKDLREYNKKNKIDKTIDMISSYKIDSKKDNMIINISTIKLDDKKRDNLKIEITELLKKYI